MGVVRTKKQFNKETLEQEQDLVRQLVSLGGMHNSPLKGDWADFSMEEKFIGVKQGGSVSPWEEHHFKEGYTKELFSIRVDYKKFDSIVNIRQDGTIHGTYKETGKALGGVNPLEVVNLLIEHGYIEYIS